MDETDEFNTSNKKRANELFTEEELTKFSKIYNYNFLNKYVKKESDTYHTEASLFRGLEIDPLTAPEKKDFMSFVIDGSIIFTKSETPVYSEEFKNNMEYLDKIINNISFGDELKYVLIGEALNEFSCNNNDYRFRLIKHILLFCDIIKNNKSILLEKQKNLINELVLLIGNCDYQNFESISNKEIEEWLRGVFNTKSFKEAPHAMKSRFLKIMNATGEYSEKFMNMLKRNFLGKRVGKENYTLKEQTKLEVTQKKMNQVRMDIMKLNELYESAYCSEYELALTYKKYEDSPKWFTNPQLIAFSASSVALSMNSAIYDQHGSANDITGAIQRRYVHPGHPDINAHALASFVSGALGPLIGLFVSVGVGKFLDSKFFKDLRNSRLINLKFIEFIANKKDYSEDLLTSETNCSFRNDKQEYTRRVELAQLKINEYNDLVNQHLNSNIKKLDFYLYAYYSKCKIDHPQTEPVVVEQNIRLRQDALSATSKEQARLDTVTEEVINDFIEGIRDMDTPKMLAIVRLMGLNNKSLITANFSEDPNNFFPYNFSKPSGGRGLIRIRNDNTPGFIDNFKQKLKENIMQNKEFYYTLTESKNRRLFGGRRTRKYKKNKKSKRYSRRYL